FLFIAGSGGSVGGLLLGSLTNSIFVDFDRVAPEDRPSFLQTDPRYIGAWWLGFVIIGCAVLLISVPFFFFPRHLPKTKERIREEEQLQGSEVVVVACMAAGNVIGGLIIRRWKLSPAQCTFILIFGEVVAILCMPAFLLVGCNTKPVAGVSTNYAAPAPFDGLPAITQPLIFPDSVQQAVSPCNVNCTCGNEDYSPVCGADGINLCVLMLRWSFSECRCIQPGGVNATAIDGECADDCPDWVVPFIITICAAMFFSSSLGKTGLALITLRIFPAPLYFGAAINLACILWGYNNGDRGACWFYDIDLFRYSFQGLIGGIRVISVLVLFGVFYTLRNVKPTEDFVNTLYAYGLRPLIDKPTRITPHSSTLIDNILTNNNTNISASANKLSLNSSKTKYMIFSRSSNSSQHEAVKIDGTAICKVHSTKFLGVIIDDKLSWSHHIASVSNVISRNTGVPSKLRSFLPSTT
ncbi:solute carrier organic anion transporter family member 5A1-like, partial [Strongylocentrotus purpuratus]|uniref:Uncharacterized protein n=1 Tax=Strongylocentrotus purpuratus TaxID=7668 RepID=A0A7M7SVK3_STRPU